MSSSTYYALLLTLVLGVGCSVTPAMKSVVGIYEGIVEGDAIGFSFSREWSA
jgi:hypothetical protein|tara:strand:+ start:170 stop:325 length:156 start_codon:yes stop_codon:yes gene_type:complete